jgi:DNA-binding MarR family transcriptional regulator
MHNDVTAQTQKAPRLRTGKVALDEFYRHGAYRAGTPAVAALDRLWGLSLLLSELMQHGLAERGITLARAGLVSLLERSDASTQRELSRTLRVTPRNITGLVDALEGEGLVVRAPHPTDRRATLVSLTSSGAALAATLKRDQDGFAERLFGDVALGELGAFIATVDRVLARIEERLASHS